jgi:CRISPR-associated protein Cas2
MRYVIAYDIVDDNRRNRVAHFLERWGRRVQKSLFECDLSPEELEKVCSRLKELMALPEDRCHIYRLCGECAPKRLVLGSDQEPAWAKAIIV